MTTANLAERTGPITPRPSASPQQRGIEGVYHPPSLHWVGDSSRVAGYFSTIRHGGKAQRFCYPDYTALRVPARDAAARRRGSSAPGVRDRDDRLAGQRRSPR